MNRTIEVMRVLRVPPMGKLVVEVKETNLESLADVSDPATRQRLLTAIGELVHFAGGYQALVDAGVAAPPATPQTTPTPSETAELDARRAEFLENLEKGSTEEAVSRPQTISLISSVRQKRAEPAPRPLSLAEQIDAILQEKIAGYPQFSGRKINLVPDPKGGLRILVDGRYYQRPSEIEEKEIAVLIKMAIKEWENRS